MHVRFSFDTIVLEFGILQLNKGVPPVTAGNAVPSIVGSSGRSSSFVTRCFFFFLLFCSFTMSILLIRTSNINSYSSFGWYLDLVTNRHNTSALPTKSHMHENRIRCSNNNHTRPLSTSYYLFCHKP